jgi:hypothetical protein
MLNPQYLLLQYTKYNPTLDAAYLQAYGAELLDRI